MNTKYNMPKNYYFGGGGDTFTTPLAIVVLLVAILLIFTLKRKYVVVPFLMGAILLPFNINLVVMGLHFPALRLLILAGCLRFALLRDLQYSRISFIDKPVLIWALCNAATFVLLWGGTGAIANRFGFLLNTLGTYFLLRFLIRDKKDIVRTIRTLAIVITVIAPFMLTEHITRHDAFFVLGADEIADIRDGAIRAKGPFSHALTAGTTGAMLLPLFVGAWWYERRDRMILAAGILSSIVITFSSTSSTPIMTCGVGVLALFLWPMRKNLRIFRRLGLLAIMVLQVVMKAPVWMLIARTGGAMGGSGYHRAMLIDNFICHFSEWWLVGTRDNASWGYDMWDVDNAYVAAGVGGGLITFVMFLAILVAAYRRVGVSRRLVEKSRRDARLVWAIGASLFANTLGFFGIVYFDQSSVAWYALLAMISATAAFATHNEQNDIELRADADTKGAELDISAIPEYSV